MTDTIVFDLDGTLLNTLDDLMDSVNYMLRGEGYPVRSYDEIRAFVGNGVGLLVERSLPEGHKDEAERCLKIFSAHYDLNKENKTRPYDGIIELLTAVKAAGYKTAIVSNKYDAAVKELADKVFSGLIDTAVGEREGVAKKPAPDGVFAALESLGSARERAVYVGDSDVDVETAKNAGLPVVGVTWGFRDRALLERMKADYIIDRPSELPEILKKI